MIEEKAADIYSKSILAECYKEPLSVATRKVAKDAFIAGVAWHKSAKNLKWNYLRVTEAEK